MKRSISMMVVSLIEEDASTEGPGAKVLFYDYHIVNLCCTSRGTRWGEIISVSDLYEI